MKTTIRTLAAVLVIVASPLAAQAPVHVPEDVPARYHPLPSVRDQAAEMQEWVEARLTRVLPALMAEYDVDMWILSMREYGEDPVFWSMISPTTFAARRRSIYVFTRQDDGSVERLASSMRSMIWGPNFRMLSGRSSMVIEPGSG